MSNKTDSVSYLVYCSSSQSIRSMHLQFIAEDWFPSRSVIIWSNKAIMVLQPGHPGLTVFHGSSAARQSTNLIVTDRSDLSVEKLKCPEKWRLGPFDLAHPRYALTHSITLLLLGY